MLIDVQRTWPKALDGHRFEVTGSTVTSAPPNDLDIFVVYTDDLHKKLTEEGFTNSAAVDSEGYENSSLVMCFRKDDLNIVATKTPQDYMRWLIATQLMQMMNLQEKHQRVTLFQFLTEGVVRGNKYPTTKEFVNTFRNGDEVNG